MFKIYIGVSIFCVILWKIYGNFSHGVNSIYMTYLFAWPLIMGALVNLVFMVIKKLPRPGSFSVNLYNSGVSALTVSSLLRGIFEIAGTACYLQTYLYNVGRLFVLAGVVVYVVSSLSLLWQNTDKHVNQKNII
jgi:hypothetical protein